MAKPATLDGYTDQHTIDCERVLVTLLRGLGPWKESVYLIGGLTPRYLVPARPPKVPSHAGTLDVDVVIDLQILADTESYHTLEENLRRMRFERAENDRGQKLSWRWQTRTERGALMVLELLADAPDIAGGRVQPLPTVGRISALNIPHSSIVFDLHQVKEIQAELLGGDGVATERVRYANVVSFTCLKALARPCGRGAITGSRWEFDLRQIPTAQTPSLRSALRTQRRSRFDLLHRARARGFGRSLRGFSPSTRHQAPRRG